MSLLRKDEVRSDGAAALSVQGCALACVRGARAARTAPNPTHERTRCRAADGAVNAIIHTRLPGESGKSVVALLQRLLESAKFQSDIAERNRLTVDAEGLSIHCMTDPQQGMFILACTSQDYPQRLVFPPAFDQEGPVGLLASIGESCCVMTQL